MKRILLALLLALAPASAWAQAANNFPTPNLGERAPLIVMGCINAGGFAVPATASGTCIVGLSQWWIEQAASTATAASATVSGTARSSGTSAGVPIPFGYFQAIVTTTQAGTLQILADGMVVASSAAPIGSTTLKTPAFGASLQSVFVNGSTAGAAGLRDGFTAN